MALVGGFIWFVASLGGVAGGDLDKQYTINFPYSKVNLTTSKCRNLTFSVAFVNYLRAKRKARTTRRGKEQGIRSGGQKNSRNDPYTTKTNKIMKPDEYLTLFLHPLVFKLTLTREKSNQRFTLT